MKSEDLRKVVFHKYEDGDNICKIYHDLNGPWGLNIIPRIGAFGLLVEMKSMNRVVLK